MPKAAKVAAPTQIAFRYRTSDSEAGVTRDTARRLAAHMGVDETQIIHRALRDLARRVLPQYEADDGPLTAAQFKQVMAMAKAELKAAAKGNKRGEGERTVRSTILGASRK